VFKQPTNKRVKKAALDASGLALQLAQDRRFRKRLLSAIRHGSEAGPRQRTEPGLMAALTRFASDRAVQSELRGARKDLQRHIGALVAEAPEGRAISDRRHGSELTVQGQPSRKSLARA
jgi:hypothetical protein